ncbi:MAG: glutamate-5-semialdehyde dehydrogenase [Clostridia bacterium]|nr:glutamate-5-semialdehyde dehydrogenase [Clostridia bacterium]
MTTKEILENALAAKPAVSVLSTEQKNRGLECMADALCEHTSDIIAANKTDLDNASKTVSSVMLDRLMLDKKRITAMADGIRAIKMLDDPVGEVLEARSLYNGLSLEKKAVPVGVIAMIYESRPNVTSDAAALCLKSGNVCVLRGGKEAINSNKMIVSALRGGLKRAGIAETAVNLVLDTTRQSATELMEAVGFVDMLIPRGGAGLIRACVENSKVPCIQTGSGICHIYVDDSADFDMALNIIENAKTSRPSVCNAAEVCLVNENIAKSFLPLLYKRLVLDRTENKVTLIGTKEVCDIIDATPCDETSFDTEFLDYILAVKTVKSVSEATEHIRIHSTGHSEAIITQSDSSIEYFTANVDSSSVYVNASTRFTDGGEFGLGCEMGISTQKLHARGPMGLKEMTSYKYIIRGNGQIR